jgi:signal transduction histidine kinase
MRTARKHWTLAKTAIWWRVLGLSLLSLLWLQGENGEAGIILLLFLTVMAVVRWRFSPPAWTVLLDQVACLLVTPFWPGAWFGMAIPVFESMLQGKPWYGLPAFASLFFQPANAFPFLAVFTKAAFSGWIIRVWSLQTETYRQEADRERRERYELERVKDDWVLATMRAASLAELAERQRIARELHDHVGHELTGAVLAMQAFEPLWKEEDPQAKELFDQAQQRVSNSYRLLRETVQAVTPVNPVGVDRLNEICCDFNNFFPVHFQVYGDTSRLSVFLWEILEPTLKEALTNVARDATATKVVVILDVSPSIVRLSVENDGVIDPGHPVGVGLRNLRQRAHAAGGNISVNTSSGFQLICVLPIGK